MVVSWPFPRCPTRTVTPPSTGTNAATGSGRDAKATAAPESAMNVETVSLVIQALRIGAAARWQLSNRDDALCRGHADGSAERDPRRAPGNETATGTPSIFARASRGAECGFLGTTGSHLRSRAYHRLRHERLCCSKTISGPRRVLRETLELVRRHII
jgi:hypothetical protein